MSAARPAVVKIEDLHLTFPVYRGSVHALCGIALEVRAGEIVGLVGESGCGKSVTAMTAIRLLPPGAYRVDAGRVVVLGHDVLALDEPALQEVRGDDVAMVFQEPMNALNPTMRVGRQMTQVMREHQDVSHDEALRQAERLLADMQIADPARVLRNYPHELSGGMRQRVLIAMAFSCNPRVLIADEPTTALDVTIQAQVLGLLKAKAEQTGASVLFITHDMAVVAQLCDRVYVMYAGRIVESGATADVLRRPQHPYTQALLRSLPELATPKQPLPSIAGTVPSLLEPPAGCHFRDRCPHAHARCLEHPPAFQEPGASAEHRAACWLLEPGSALSSPERPPGGSSAAPPSLSSRSGEGRQGGALLRLEGVHVHFAVGTDWRGRPRGHVHALNGIDLEVYRGEVLGVVGESGCGKSTLGQVVMALLRPSGGRVLFDGADLTALGTAARSRLRRRFQVVFQDPQSSLNPRMPVWRVITEPLLVAGLRSATERRARAEELARQVGLGTHQLGRYPHEFSGGQRQRIAIARALALQPDLLVLDEPTSALDVSVQAQILNLLLRLQRELELTYVFVSHDVSVIRHMADRVAVMYLGQVVELGSMAEVLERPAHPYTRTLLAAVPRLEAGTGRGPAVAGGKTELPSNLTLPRGCFFRDRCRFASDGCERPQALRERAPGHLVRCHRTFELPCPERRESGANHDR